MHNPELEIDQETEAVCPRCGHIGDVLFYGLQGERKMHGECEVCECPLELPRDATHQSEPDYEYLSGKYD